MWFEKRLIYATEKMTQLISVYVRQILKLVQELYEDKRGNCSAKMFFKEMKAIEVRKYLYLKVKKGYSASRAYLHIFSI